nr:MAG TPA: hypothetical protein [Caudoviricetes sp.]
MSKRHIYHLWVKYNIKEQSNLYFLRGILSTELNIRLFKPNIVRNNVRRHLQCNKIIKIFQNI